MPGTNRLGLLLTAGALSAQAAIAADIPAAWRSRTPAAPVAAAAGASTRHAHGNLLLASFQTGGADAAAVFANPADGALDSRALPGDGLGYTSKWLRAGATVGYGTFDPGGRIAAADDPAAKAGGIAAPLGGYFDLDAWYGLTPVVGAQAGERSLNLGDAGPATEFAGATAPANLTAHEVRVGVRWNFDDVRIR